MIFNGSLEIVIKNIKNSKTIVSCCREVNKRFENVETSYFGPQGCLNRNKDRSFFGAQSCLNPGYFSGPDLGRSLWIKKATAGQA